MPCNTAHATWCASHTRCCTAVCCVPQIQRLMLSFPLTSHGYQYTFISLGTALSLGLLIYGIPVWTMH
jgi:hypothetical protein